VFHKQFPGTWLNYIETMQTINCINRLLSPRFFQMRVFQPHGVLSRSFARYQRNVRMPVPRVEKRLDVVIFGHPNVGKSVLLNCLIEHKVAATAHKKHTTRGEILGFFNNRNVQLAFYDTPGYLTSQKAQTHEMKALRSVGLAATAKADVILLCVDANVTQLSSKQQDWFADMAKVAMENAKQEVVLVLNKVDLVEPKIRLLETTRQLVSLLNGVKLGLGREKEAELDTTTFMISALENDGVVDLKNYLITLAKHKPWLRAGGNEDDGSGDGDGVSDSDSDSDSGSDTDTENNGITRSKRSNRRTSKGKMSNEKPLLDSAAFTTMSPEQIVEECILESMLEHTHEEIPYIAKIRCKDIKKIPGTEGRVSITCTIEVDTKSQARIVVGAGARTLVKIRQTACLPLEQMLGVKYVLLTLNVETRFDEKGKMKKSAIEDLNDD